MKGDIPELTPQQAAFAMKHLPDALRDELIVAAGKLVYDARHWHRGGRYARPSVA